MYIHAYGRSKSMHIAVVSPEINQLEILNKKKINIFIQQ